MPLLLPESNSIAQSFLFNPGSYISCSQHTRYLVFSRICEHLQCCYDNMARCSAIRTVFSFFQNTKASPYGFFSSLGHTFSHHTNTLHFAGFANTYSSAVTTWQGDPQFGLPFSFFKTWRHSPYGCLLGLNFQQELKLVCVVFIAYFVLKTIQTLVSQFLHIYTCVTTVCCWFVIQIFLQYFEKVVPVIKFHASTFLYACDVAFLLSFGFTFHTTLVEGFL